MQPATIGSQLLYTYQASDHCSKTVVGHSRPAVVTKDWGSCYNVTVFPDAKDFDDGRATLTRTSVLLGECVAKGYLHWPGSPVDAPAMPKAEAEQEPEREPEPNAVLSLGPEGLKLEELPAEPVTAPEAPAPKRKPGKPGKPGRPKKTQPAAE